MVNTRRYGPLRRPTSSSCGGLRTSAKVFFCPAGKKKKLSCFFGKFLAILVSSSKLSNFKKNTKNSKNLKNTKNKILKTKKIPPLVATHHLSSDTVACSVLYSEVHFTTSALADGRRSDMDGPRTDNPQV